MTFSAEVKEELAGHNSPARHCQMAELAAILETEKPERTAVTAG